MWFKLQNYCYHLDKMLTDDSSRSNVKHDCTSWISAAHSSNQRNVASRNTVQHFLGGLAFQAVGNMWLPIRQSNPCVCVTVMGLNISVQPWATADMGSVGFPISSSMIQVPQVEAQGFQCLGHSNWTICSILSKFYFKIVQLITFMLRSPFSYYPREEKAEYEKRDVTKNG